MAKMCRYRKKAARICAFAGFWAVLCLFTLFVTTSAYVSDYAERRTACQNSASCAEISPEAIRCLITDINTAQSGLPINEKVNDVPLSPEEPEAFKTEGTCNLAHEIKISCSCEYEEFSCSELSGRVIVSNIKNNFYCRI